MVSGQFLRQLIGDGCEEERETAWVASISVANQVRVERCRCSGLRTAALRIDTVIWYARHAGRSHFHWDGRIATVGVHKWEQLPNLGGLTGIGSMLCKGLGSGRVRSG